MGLHLTPRSQSPVPNASPRIDANVITYDRKTDGRVGSDMGIVSNLNAISNIRVYLNLLFEPITASGPMIAPNPIDVPDRSLPSDEHAHHRTKDNRSYPNEGETPLRRAHKKGTGFPTTTQLALSGT